MKWVIIILIVLAVLLAAALIWTAMKRKKNEVARQRAGELRSEAATSAVAKQEQEARAREAQAEAERARAQADKLDARAQAERTSYDQTRAVQEDRLREADRLDPDVDHRDPEYQPGAGAVPGEQTGEHTGDHTESHGAHAVTQPGHSTGTANPVPPGPETTAPEETRRDQI
jgi:FtsZ-interacting cell division protein ZipA